MTTPLDQATSSILDQSISDRYAIYNGDCMDVMAGLPAGSVHLSIFSPPFGGMYHYSSDERDLSNCVDYDEFLEHYRFIVKELGRVTMPGRMTAVHCTDALLGNTGHGDYLLDLPGDIIRVHAPLGWDYVGRYHVWKEPLTVRNRTMVKGLFHRTLTEDSTRCSLANADYLLIFRKHGDNPVPVEHPTGLMSYAGAREVPRELLRYRGWTGDQTGNRYSHWIWRQYASAFWDDVRLDRILPFRESRDEDDEKHLHPLQLDVIERCLVLWSNPGEVVFDPFGGVGSTPYAAVTHGRFGLASELKPSFYKQMCRNMAVAQQPQQEALTLFDLDDPDTVEEHAVTEGLG